MEAETNTRESQFAETLGKFIFGMHEARGYRAGLRKCIIRAAQRRGLVLTDEQQQCISNCEDKRTLDRWFENVLIAEIPVAIFL